MHVARLLLEAGADKDLPDWTGGTALMRAAFWGHAPVVQLLLEAGAEADLRSRGDSTALILAAEEDHALVVQLLLEAGARHDVRDPRGRTHQRADGCFKDRRGPSGEVAPGGRR